MSRPKQWAGTPVDDDETALVRAAQANLASFGPLYERFVDRVYAYLRMRSSSDEDAADLTQQVFLQAMRALPKYRSGSRPFAAWLFRIAHNLSVNHHRGRTSTIDWDAVPEDLHPRAGYDPEETTIQREEARSLRALVAQLDSQACEIVLLRFSASLSLAEIAQVIGMSEGATKQRLYRAIRSLKEHYHA